MLLKNAVQADTVLLYTAFRRCLKEIAIKRLLLTVTYWP